MNIKLKKHMQGSTSVENWNERREEAKSWCTRQEIIELDSSKLIKTLNLPRAEPILEDNIDE